MAGSPTVITTFKDIESNDRVRDSIEARCQHLAGEFPEVTRFEITCLEDGTGFTVHAHATGKGTDVDSHAGASELAPAADQVLDKLERQLRRVHDKRIFGQRRDAQKDPPKRKTQA